MLKLYKQLSIAQKRLQSFTQTLQESECRKSHKMTLELWHMQCDGHSLNFDEWTSEEQTIFVPFHIRHHIQKDVCMQNRMQFECFSKDKYIFVLKHTLRFHSTCTVAELLKDAAEHSPRAQEAHLAIHRLKLLGFL